MKFIFIIFLLILLVEKIFVSDVDLSEELKHVHVDPIFELSKEIS